jgi:hypothetical protein
MCYHQEPTLNEPIRADKKYRLADFFNMHWDEYIQSPAHYVKPEQLKAVNAMRVCRTAVLGVRTYACPDCGEISNVYHSCKNRFCPTCSWKDTIKWAEKIKFRMLKIKHRHIVCTLPHSLHPLIKKNEQLLLGCLMRASADTFKDWFENKHRLKIGIILVLHTYGEQKDYHPHVHMIVSWGGVDIKTGALEEVKDEYINYKFLQKKFRCKFEDELVELNDKGKLEHGFSVRQEFMNHLKQVNEKDWQLHLEPAINTPVEVIRYIGRYSKRACLSEYKITGMEGGFISFRYKDYKDRDENKRPKEKELSLHYREFFPRLLQHVPAKNFRIVRYYGLYSNHGHISNEYFYSEDQVIEAEQEKDPIYCEHCQTRKVLVNIYFDTRTRKERTAYETVKYKKKEAA